MMGVRGTQSEAFFWFDGYLSSWKRLRAAAAEKLRRMIFEGTNGCSCVSVVCHVYALSVLHTHMVK